MALTPVAPTLSSLGTNGFQIDVNADGNPAGTFYAFRVGDGATTKFVDALGQLQDTVVWLNVTTITLVDGVPNTTYTVDLEAADDAAGLNNSGFGPSTGATTLAAVPGTPTFSFTFSTTVLINWLANSNPDGTEYFAEISPDMNFISNVTNSGWVTTLGHEFTNLLPNTVYYARVKARNSTLVETAHSSLGSTTTPAGPERVANVRVIDLVAERGFLICWAPNQETNISGYNVYRSSSPTDDAEFNKLNSSLIPSNVRSFIDRVPYSFGIVYYYKVTAVDDGGNESSITLSQAVHDNTFHSFEEQPFPIIVTDGDFISDEILTGTIDGVNTVFTTQFPYRPNSIQVYQTGVRLRKDVDFTETGAQEITLTFAPPTGTDLRVTYRKFGTGV